jgi:hypothetical protein
LAREEEVGGFLVEDNDGFGLGGVVPGQVAAADLHAHAGKVAGGDDIDEGAGTGVAGVVDALDAGGAPAAVAGEREVVREAGGFDAGDAGDFAEDGLVEGAADFHLVAGALLDLHAVALGWAEAEVDIEDVEEAA